MGYGCKFRPIGYLIINLTLSKLLKSDEHLKIRVTILMLFMATVSARSQDSEWQLSIHSPGDKEEVLRSYVSTPFIYEGDSLGLIGQLNEVISKVRSDGYLLANLDSIAFDVGLQKVEVWLFIGNKFQWARS